MSVLRHLVSILAWTERESAARESPLFLKSSDLRPSRCSRQGYYGMRVSEPAQDRSRADRVGGIFVQQTAHGQKDAVELVWVWDSQDSFKSGYVKG